MFVTLTKFDTAARIITEIIGMILLALLVIGYKTRLSAVSLFVLYSGWTRSAVSICKISRWFFGP
eukprot:m.690904 g.690904  ORF g.690904 m.690904 type:complete len:65 (+) comp22852_c0_seq31:324-518(+)